MMLQILGPAGLSGAIVEVVAAATTTSPWLMVALALLTGGVGAAGVSAFGRRRSGEDRGAAAESVGVGAGQVAEGATHLVGPLNQKIVELTRLNIELEGKLTQSRREEADRAIRMADMQAEMLRVQRDADSQFREDHIEIHQLRHDLGEAQMAVATGELERDQLAAQIHTLEVQLGNRPDRRDDDRRA